MPPPESPGDTHEQRTRAQRVCNTLSREENHWVFFSNVSSALVTDKLNFINIGRFPKFKPHFKHADRKSTSTSRAGPESGFSDDHSPPPLVDAPDGEGTLDHIRVQSDFYFAPSLRDYPFNEQVRTFSPACIPLCLCAFVHPTLTCLCPWHPPTSRTSRLNLKSAVPR